MGANDIGWNSCSVSVYRRSRYSDHAEQAHPAWRRVRLPTDPIEAAARQFVFRVGTMIAVKAHAVLPAAGVEQCGAYGVIRAVAGRSPGLHGRRR